MDGKNDGNTKKLRNRICLRWLHWKNFGCKHWMFFSHLFTFCTARVSALMIVLSDSPCERIGKWETCPILEKDTSLVRVYLEHLRQKIAALLSVSRATVSVVMSAYTNRVKTSSAKRNSERKWTMSEIDRHTLRRIDSKNHKTTAIQLTTELNIHLEDSFHKNCATWTSQIRLPQWGCDC
jgi:hypothetical protein